MARKVLKHTNFSIGMQVEFFFNWSQWVSNFNQPDQSNELGGKTSSNLQKKDETINNIQCDTVRESKLVAADSSNRSSLINLNDILSNGPYGKVVLDYYKSHNSLNDRTRKVLLEAFLQHCISTGITVTKANCQLLSVQIRETFKGEIAVKIFL